MVSGILPPPIIIRVPECGKMFFCEKEVRATKHPRNKSRILIPFNLAFQKPSLILSYSF
jgi:hypothetical protein